MTKAMALFTADTPTFNQETEDIELQNCRRGRRDFVTRLWPLKRNIVIKNLKSSDACFGLGKDGRSLSFHQSKRWMVSLRKYRKYKHMAKGEESGVAKLTEPIVRQIRAIPSPLKRSAAASIAKRFGIHPNYVYHLRSSDPERRHWNHLDRRNTNEKVHS